MADLKASAKSTLARTLGRLYRTRAARNVVLCYHSVHPTLDFRSCTPAAFDQHLEWLKSNCTILPLEELVADRARPATARPRVAITFDDGYIDNYAYAFPALQKHAVPATFFLTVGFVGRDPLVLDRFAELRGKPVEPLTWQHAREMLSAGMHLGAHTYTHPNLAYVDRPRLGLELDTAKQQMEQSTGQEVRAFAYPFGKPGRHFTRETAVLVEQVGYRCAAAVLFRGLSQRDSMFAIPRFFTTRDTVGVLEQKIRGDWDLLGYWQQAAPLWLARRISPRDFLP
jgi:peptidoglycan/xylan/chitin deacetylase (PgdA/CDA1 family)